MTYILRREAFDRPFRAKVVGSEVLLESDQAPVELAFTVESARETALSLLRAADSAEEGSEAGRLWDGRRP
ncbi:MAG: hypothetical protein JO127_17110 [Caulobacteraceae bacterium]|nr:hypothetical protein [Caulobacteraceae bacterium]